jgi:hypothetical protein
MKRNLEMKTIGSFTSVKEAAREINRKSLRKGFVVIKGQLTRFESNPEFMAFTAVEEEEEEESRLYV